MTSSPATPPAPEAAPKPSATGDFVSLAKPGITALIVLVAVGGFLIASPGAVNAVRLAVLLVTGAAASAGASMLNHYLDRDLDARMRRTEGRPLPDARITPSSLVAALGLLLLGAGIGGAAVFLNPLTGVSIFLGGLTYVVVYTAWLKRRSSWNIVVGGFAGSAPALAGSAAAGGTWTHGALALALLVFLWTPPHFWSLAMMLRDEYKAAGLPMLPRMDDPSYSGRVVVVSAALLLPATLLLLALGPITWPVAIVLLAAAIGFIVATLPLWASQERRLALRGFLYSGPYLVAVIVAILVNWALLRAGVGGL